MKQRPEKFISMKMSCQNIFGKSSAVLWNIDTVNYTESHEFNVVYLSVCRRDIYIQFDLGWYVWCHSLPFLNSIQGLWVAYASINQNTRKNRINEVKHAQMHLHMQVDIEYIHWTEPFFFRFVYVHLNSVFWIEILFKNLTFPFFLFTLFTINTLGQNKIESKKSNS